MSIRRAYTPVQSGFTLIEMMMGLAVGMIVIVAASMMLVSTAQNYFNANAKVQMEINKLAILKTATSPAAWAVTLSKNQPAMACLMPELNLDCVPNQPLPFDLWDARGNPIFQATKPRAGFTLQGENCDGFDKALGNDKCPFRYELQWSAVCDTSGNLPCRNPQVMINAHLFYRPSRDSNLPKALDEDGLSINTLILPASVCTGGAQQTFFYNTLGSTSLTINFVVPSFSKNLYVELWGGGGGGPSYNWLNGTYVAGGNGGDSSFSPPSLTALVAKGGFGGYSAALSARSWWYTSTLGFISIGSGSCDGFPGEAPKNQNLLSGVKSCAPLGATEEGGSGGRCGGTINGNSYGGGGASAGGWVTNCADWALLYVPQSSPNGGQNASGTFTPAQIPPGTVVPIVVGAGGTGAVGYNFTSCWGAFPSVGGKGGSGLVKITWE